MLRNRWNNVWVRWHLMWANWHQKAGEESNKEAFSFLELGDLEECERLNRIAQEESGRIPYRLCKARLHLLKLTNLGV